MNELARIDAVKASDMTAREIELKLVRDAGFSRSVAKSLMAQGIAGLNVKRDADEMDLSELRAALAERLTHPHGHRA